MNENPKSDDSANGGTGTGTPDRWESRRMRREERRAARGGGGAWAAGLLLIGLGVLFLLQNTGTVIALNNWWALFILLPAIGAFGNAWRAYQAAGGRLTAAARGSLIGGLILVLITAIFLFGLNWGLLGPVVIILVGAGLLLNALLPA